MDRHSAPLPDRQRGQEENRRAASADPSPEIWHRNLPVLQNAARQDLAREIFTPPDSALIDIHDDYGGNWFSRTRNAQTGYTLVLESRQQKGLYIDIRV